MRDGEANTQPVIIPGGTFPHLPEMSSSNNSGHHHAKQAGFYEEHRRSTSQQNTQAGLRWFSLRHTRTHLAHTHTRINCLRGHVAEGGP